MRRRRIFRVAGYIFGGLVAFVVLLALGGLALPKEATWADVTTDLDAPAAELFAVFNSREGQQKMWSRAAERGGAPESAMHLADLGGPDEGAGTRIGFYPADGTESLAAVPGDGEIVESIPGRKVVLTIDFGVITSERIVTLRPLSENTTRVHWVETLRAANPLMRYAFLLQDDAIADGFADVLRAAEDVAAP